MFPEICGTHFIDLRWIKGCQPWGHPVVLKTGTPGLGFMVLLVDSKQQISFWGSNAVYGILLLGQGCCSFNQYNLQDGMLQLNSNPTLY